MPRAAKSESVPEALKERYQAIVAITDVFCAEHLNEEYAQCCRYMAATLARKRPSPLLSGRPNTWAAGIVHALGTVNFLFDSTQKPHMRASALAASFGLGVNTVNGKSKAIRDLLKIGIFDTDWTLPSRMDDNPLAWSIMVDGFIMDARYVSRALQEEAFRRGLIPYVPGSEDE